MVKGELVDLFTKCTFQGMAGKISTRDRHIWFFFLPDPTENPRVKTGKKVG